VALVLVALAGGSAVALADSQADGIEELESRFAARGQLSAEFVATFAEQLLDREEDVARTTLSGGEPSAPFDALVSAFGFHAALLLDGQGRVLAVSPANPELLGKEVASGYPHLSAAVAGRRAISPVVPSAALGDPVVGFAVPYDTPAGRRVMSGAFLISDTPLGSYLSAFSSLRGYRAYLLDSSGTVVASSDDRGGRTAEDVVPELLGRLGDGASGVVAAEGGPEFFAAHDVDGTPWRLVTVVPEETLLQPVRGASQWLPWVILVALLGVVGVTYLLGLRLVDSRHRLRQANARLDDIANRDLLTGVATRRRAAEVLAAELERCARAELPLSVLLVDVDHFKRVNDTFGHASGDEVLREVAGRVEAALRDGDHLGRWGGEEFLVVLPETSLAEAEVVGERLREAVAAAPVPLGTGGDEIDVTASVGVATSGRLGPEAVVHTADRALYAAKAAGRNVVVAFGR
jgi:diguanylate cyclase (GGDEF)-like protein